MKKAPARKRQLTRKKTLIGKTGAWGLNSKTENFPFTVEDLAKVTQAAEERIFAVSYALSKLTPKDKIILDIVRRLSDWNFSRLTLQ